MIVNTISDLRTATIPPDNYAKVLGYYNPLDGGEGEFYWDNASTDSDNGGTVIQKNGLGTGRWKRLINAWVSVDMFGAKGNANYLSSGQLWENNSYSIPATDDTATIQSCFNWAISNGFNVFFSKRGYLITEEISIMYNTPPPPYRPFSISGLGTGMGARLWFNPGSSDHNMFSFQQGSLSYFRIENLELIDAVPGSSKCLNWISTRTSSPIPQWKIAVMNFRITNFKIGLHVQGGATIYDDAYLSECLFMHGKFRNCRTAAIFENIQCVNHQWLAVDIENDAIEDITEHWKMFHFKRGTQINHIGGSIVGTGPYIYLEITTPGHFQYSTRFNSYGVRSEWRDTGNPVPFIWHAENSVINFSNGFEINLDNLSIVDQVNISTDHIFAKLGSQVILNLNNVIATKKMYVIAVQTQYMASTFSYGNIDIHRCTNIDYKAVRPSGIEYGSGPLTSTGRHTIPAKIENIPYNSIIEIDTNGYYVIKNKIIDILAPGFNSSSIKQLVFSPSWTTGMFDGQNPGTIKVMLPLGMRPFRLAVLKEDTGKSNTAIFTIQTTIAGSTITLCTLDTTGLSGWLETPLQTSSTLNELYVDGTIWNGNLTITRSGTTNAFRGLISLSYL
ncbi:MAG: hypothetical protein QM594_02545 [Niabella sp.]